MVRDGGGGLHLRLRDRVRVLVGASRVACAKRDIPIGDKVGRTEHHGVREHALHVPGRAGLLSHALPHEVRAVHVLRLLCGVDDGLRLLLPAGDEEYTHRGDDQRVEGALVLEAVHGRGWSGPSASGLVLAY